MASLANNITMGFGIVGCGCGQRNWPSLPSCSWRRLCIYGARGSMAEEEEAIMVKPEVANDDFFFLMEVEE